MNARIVTGILAISLLQAIPKQANKPDANKQTGDNPVQNPVAPTPNQNPTPEQNRAKAEADEPSLCERIWSPLLANWPLIAVSVWGIYVATGTLKKISDQADQMVIQNTKFDESIKVAGDAAQAAKDSAEQTRKATEITQQQFALIRSKERAHIVIEYELLKFELADYINASVTYHVRFFGLNPALIVETGIMATFQPSIFAPNSYLPIDIPSVVNAEIRNLKMPVMPPNMNSDDRDALCAGTAFIQFSAFIEYRDIVDEAEVHRTAVAVRWTPNPFYGSGNYKLGDWKKFGPPEANIRT